MSKKPLLWQIGTSFTFLMILTLVSTGFIVMSSLRAFHLAQVEKKLTTEAKLITPKLLNRDALKKQSALESLSLRLKSLIDADITVISLSGEILSDTRSGKLRKTLPPSLNPAGSERSVRLSTLAKGNVLYISSAIQSKNGEVLAVLQLSKPLTAISQEISSLTQKLLWTGLAILFLSAVIVWVIATKLLSPLLRVTAAAKSYNPKSQRVRVPVSGTREISELAITFNKMVSRLEKQFREIVGERNKLDSVLESMVEGVIAFDSEENILSLNHAAEELLGLDEEKVVGMSMQEHIRNSHFQRLIRETLLHLRPIEDEVILQRPAGLTVQANTSPLVDPAGEAIGALLVFHDISRLRQLERVRKEFVSNVSHELKTPITSIQGFAETILAGAIENRDDTERFLNIISRQARQLHAIVDDLLTLSRLEHTNATDNLRMETSQIRTIVDAAIEVCQHGAKAKDIEINVHCSAQLSGTVSSALLEQALVNLVTNAVRYSPNGKSVSLSVTEHDGMLIFEVQDQGVGIDAEHLERLFERFYRADPARSRKVGGTGLGLSIVKHIANAHNGSVDVKSTPNVGSTFTIRIPVTPPQASQVDERSSRDSSELRLIKS